MQGNKPIDVSGRTEFPKTSKPMEQEQEPRRKSTKTEDAQRPIQSMEKQEDGEEYCPKCKKDMKECVCSKKEATEYPKEEKPTKEFPPEVKEMVKAFEALKAEHEELKKSLPGMVKKESEERLRKSGFREEKSYAPQLAKQLGTDDTPIIKSADTPGEVAEELTKLSYRQLWEMKTKIEMGQTDGIPQELMR